MAELVYTRVSTDEQSRDRRTHLLAEGGLVDGADGVRMFAVPASSSKIPALEREGFRELAGYARPGDRLTVSELYRLRRDLADILAVRGWRQEHSVKLRVMSGALSSITDLAATDATTTMLVNVLISVGQFQRDLQYELMREGLAAAWAQGARSGRRPQITAIGRWRRCARNSTQGCASPPWPAATTSAGSRSAPPWPTCGSADPHNPYSPTVRTRARSESRCRARAPATSCTSPRRCHVHQALLVAADIIGESVSAADRKAYRIYRD